MPLITNKKNTKKQFEELKSFLDESFAIAKVDTNGIIQSINPLFSEILKYNSTNIFVAECKIWHGVNEYFKAIDQLLGYLTWRDSKSALIIFVKQIDISGIIKKIEKETEKHKNYISFKNKSTDGVYSFRFNLSTNNKKEISLTVMLYHVNNK